MKKYLAITAAIFTILFVGCKNDPDTEFYKEMAQEYAYTEFYYREPIKEIPIEEVVDYMVEHGRARYVTVYTGGGSDDTTIIDKTMNEHIYELVEQYNSRARSHNEHRNDLQNELEIYRLSAIMEGCTNKTFDKYVKKYSKKYKNEKTINPIESEKQRIEQLLKIIDTDTIIYDSIYILNTA